MLPLLICGAGRVVERLYGPALSRSSRFTVAAVIDPSNERRSWASDYFHAPAFASIAEAVASTKATSALVAVPPWSQEEVVLQLLDRRISVLVEKPGALSLPGAQTLAEAAGQVPLRLALTRSFWPRYRALRRNSAESTGRWRIIIETNPEAWHSHEARPAPASGNVGYDLLPHAFDLAVNVVGADLAAIAKVSSEHRSLLVEIGAPNPGTIQVGYGRHWHESVSLVGGGRLRRSRANAASAVRRILSAGRLQLSEPVLGAVRLLDEFAQDIACGRTSKEFLVDCATFLERVLSAPGLAERKEAQCSEETSRHEG